MTAEQARQFYAQQDPLSHPARHVALYDDLPAGQDIRAGVRPPEAFGHGDERGLWFVHVNLHRDLLALSNRHISEWDAWRAIGPAQKQLSDDDCAAGDRVALAVARYSHDGPLASLHALAETYSRPSWTVLDHPGPVDLCLH